MIRKSCSLIFPVVFALLFAIPQPVSADEVPASTDAAPADNTAPDGFDSLFDGRTMAGWEGNPVFWSVSDGCLTGTSTAQTPVPYSQYLIWKGLPADNFELLVDFRIESGNSGIEYRAWRDPARSWGLNGYQADICPGDIMGLVYGEGLGEILAWRGQTVKTGADRKPVLVVQFASAAELAKSINMTGWNTYRIVAAGNRLTQYINGVKVSELIEDDVAAPKGGTFGFQVHPGPPMKVQFKNVFLKRNN